jgi:hypothetical protein
MVSASAKSPLLDAKNLRKKTQFVTVRDADTHLSTIRDDLMRRLSICSSHSRRSCRRISKRLLARQIETMH